MGDSSVDVLGARKGCRECMVDSSVGRRITNVALGGWTSSRETEMYSRMTYEPVSDRPKVITKV